jgi:hypothetical protein
MFKVFSILQYGFYTIIFDKQFNFVASSLKIIGYGNSDNNLEPPCMFYAQYSFAIRCTVF